MYRTPLRVALLLAAFALPAVRAEDALVFEERCPDPKLAKIVLVAGKPSHKPGEHEFLAGCHVLRLLLRQSPGVFPVIVREGWPTQPETFEGAKAILFFTDGGGVQPTIAQDHLLELQKLADRGVGIAHLHAVIDYPTDLGERARTWLGGCYEPKYSKRAHWVTEFKQFPDHPIFRGVAPFKIDDGYLYKLRFQPDLRGITPVLRTQDPKSKAPLPAGSSEDIVAWTYDRPAGGRSFVFTGGHLHASFAEPGYRRFLVQALLWTAGQEVPATGAPVQLELGELKKHLAIK